MAVGVRMNICDATQASNFVLEKLGATNIKSSKHYLTV